MQGPQRKKSKGQQGDAQSKPTPTLGGQAVVAAAGEQQAMRIGFVNLYKHAPTGAIDLQTFEAWAKGRMYVLKGIDTAQAQGVWGGKKMQECVHRLLQQYMPEPRSAAELEEARAADNTSHFILRLAYSRTAALRKWFVEKEEVLFRHRFNSVGRDARSAGMGGLQPIGEAEFETLAAELRAVFAWRDVGTGHAPDEQARLYFQDAAEQWTHVYTAPFEQVADLVKYRKVLLRGGCAYLVSSDAASVAATALRERLQHGLAVCCQNLHCNVAEDEAERLAPLLFGLPMFEQCAAFGAVSALALQHLPAAMKESAPLCMRRSFAVLTTKHHLKHGGRWQLGMFLKGIGVSMDDAVALWRTEFMQGGKTAEEFEKQYSYNIKHQYGQAGSRNDYKAQSCQKVIAAGRDPTCGTGCPFKTSASNELKCMLQQMHVPLTVVTQAVSDAEQKNYQLACSKVYQGLHGKELVAEVVTHPNQYFEESRRHYKERQDNEGKAGEVVSLERRVMTARAASGGV